jgi:hypothetical protein
MIRFTLEWKYELGVTKAMFGLVVHRVEQNIIKWNGRGHDGV